MHLIQTKTSRQINLKLSISLTKVGTAILDSQNDCLSLSKRVDRERYPFGTHLLTVEYSRALHKTDINQRLAQICDAKRKLFMLGSSAIYKLQLSHLQMNH